MDSLRTVIKTNHDNRPPVFAHPSQRMVSLIPWSVFFVGFPSGWDNLHKNMIAFLPKEMLLDSIS